MRHLKLDNIKTTVLQAHKGRCSSENHAAGGMRTLWHPLLVRAAHCTPPVACVSYAMATANTLTTQYMVRFSHLTVQLPEDQTKQSNRLKKTKVSHFITGLRVSISSDDNTHFSLSLLHSRVDTTQLLSN